MGTINNYSVMAVGMNDLIELVEEFKTTLPQDIDDIVLGPFKGVNMTVTYVFCTSGSKEGWDTAIKATQFREAFVDVVKSAKYADVIELTWGESFDRLQVKSNIR